MSEKTILGFRKGLEIEDERHRSVRRELKRVLDITTDVMLSNYASGRSKLKTAQAMAVRNVFASHGIDDPFDYSELDIAIEENPNIL